MRTKSTATARHERATRILDVCAAAIGLLLLSPLFVVVALLIKSGSRGPVLHSATRVGRGGRLFTLYKFRSMLAGAATEGPGITAAGDVRVTPVGRALRRTKIDELPQLFNVLRGEMSLVGPRPEDPRYVALYSPAQRALLEVRPGITSPASLFYRDEERVLTGKDWERHYINRILPTKLAIDLDYIQRRTLRSDLRLILQTVATAMSFRSQT